MCLILNAHTFIYRVLHGIAMPIPHHNFHSALLRLLHIHIHIHIEVNSQIPLYILNKGDEVPFKL